MVDLIFSICQTLFGIMLPLPMENPADSPNLREITDLFDMRGDFVAGIPYGSGHINDTFCVNVDQAGLSRIRYIFQRINTRVFRMPEQLMENISRVTQFSLGRLLEQRHPEAHRRTLTCIPAKDGRPFAVDPDSATKSVPFRPGSYF